MDEDAGMDISGPTVDRLILLLVVARILEGNAILSRHPNEGLLWFIPFSIVPLADSASSGLDSVQALLVSGSNVTAMIASSGDVANDSA